MDRPPAEGLARSLEREGRRSASTYARDGWPKDPSLLADADSIVVVSDGRDGDKYSEAPHLESPERVAEVQKLIDRGCGLCVLHFSTFAPDKYAPQVLDWTGGYFDWEENGERKWYSAIKTIEGDVVPVGGKHPTLSGVRPWRMKEEFYFNIRFAPGEPSIAPGATIVNGVPARRHADGSTTQPLVVVPALGGNDDDGLTVAWARERKTGGRGFGTTCGHFYDNWKHDDFRKLVLNALVWSAQGEVPKDGVDGPFLSRAAIMSAITEPFDPKSAGEDAAGTVTPPEKKTTQSAAPNIRLVSQKTDKDANPATNDAPIRVLMFAGNDAHKWHNWEKTTPIIEKLLEIDPRITVDISNNIEDLATKLRRTGWQTPLRRRRSELRQLARQHTADGRVEVRVCRLHRERRRADSRPLRQRGVSLFAADGGGLRLAGIPEDRPPRVEPRRPREVA